MANEQEISIRELRNHTKQVIDDIERGTTVFLTRNGTRIATIAPLVEKTWAEQVADILGDGPAYDSGIAAVLQAEDRRAAETDDEHLPNVERSAG